MNLLTEHVGNAVVLLCDRLEPKPYLQELVGLLREENAELTDENQIQYLVCKNYFGDTTR